MGLDENEVNGYLRPLLGQYEDSLQDAWVEILERKAQTISEVAPIVKKVKNRAIRQYMDKKCKEASLHKPLGNNGDGTFTLESILPSPTYEDTDGDREPINRLYAKMVEFLIDECVRQKNEIRDLKKKGVELKERRLRLREEWIEFKRERFEAWKQLMEAKGKEKEYRLTLKLQLQRERLAFRREQMLVKAGRGG
jgi:uncharacterized protein YlaI